MKTYFEEIIDEYFHQRNPEIISEQRCTEHPNIDLNNCDDYKCPDHKNETNENCARCVHPLDCAKCQWNNIWRTNHLNSIAELLKQSRRRKMYSFIGPAKGSSLMVNDLPKVDDAFHLNTWLFKACANHADSFGKISVAEAINLWSKSDANARGGSTVNKNFKKIIPIIVKNYINSQDKLLSLEETFENIQTEINNRLYRTKPTTKSLRQWLRHLNSIQGLGYPVLQDFQPKQRGRKLGNKNNPLSPHRPSKAPTNRTI